jgi:hypothetical protein
VSSVFAAPRFLALQGQTSSTTNNYNHDVLSAVAAVAAAQAQAQAQVQQQTMYIRAAPSGHGVLMQNGASIHSNAQMAAVQQHQQQQQQQLQQLVHAQQQQQLHSPTHSSDVGVPMIHSPLSPTLSMLQPGLSPLGSFALPPPSTVETNFTGSPLFVYHLPLEATESTLFQLFSSFGEVASAKVMRDLLTGRSKGYGFVNMATEQQAVAAIHGLNGFNLGTKFIKVSFKSQQAR